MNKYIENIKQIALPNKYTKYYCGIIEKALSRPQNRKDLKIIYGYVESHHILPKCFKLGGEKDKENLVFLTAKEHFIVHLCATKMFTSSFKNKMVFAFRQLKSSNQYQNRYMNARLYEKIKPNFKHFVRLYKGESVKYISTFEISEIEELKNNGWTLKMTPEYKVGRCGNFGGRKHSEETKIKIGNSNRKPRESMRGVKKSKESIQKTIQTKQKNKIENPEKYNKYIESCRQRTIQLHKDGVFSKNGMEGKLHSYEAKQKMSEKRKKRWEIIKNDSNLYKETCQNLSEAQFRKWKNPELKKNAYIFNSKAYQKYNILPEEFYTQKLKPLLYFGFLPTSMVRYNLIDMSKCSIVRLIKEFGTEEDKRRFQKNKEYMAGANRRYINFLARQYTTYFKDKEINIIKYENFNIDLEYKKYLEINSMM